MSDRKKKIYVGLSGGVDSSVAAALLQKAGHDVTAIYLKVWSPDLEDLLQGCPWEEDVQYADATAKHLGIPFEVWDVSKEYFDTVVDYFVAEHRRGRTPNPDIMCNREMKFGIFLKRALVEGADVIATGHYVRKLQLATGHWQLAVAADQNKDQSYFLYTLTQEQLRHALFPIGEYTKPEVRGMAQEHGLPTAKRKDSQGICFLGKIPVKEFLKRRIPAHTGELVTFDGRVVGQHEGAEFYTIGQRHGIGSPGGGTAYYVAQKDLAANRVVVAESDDASELQKSDIRVQTMHWIEGISPQFPLACMARIRYRQPVKACTVYEDGRVVFHTAQRAVTSGQACVFYDGDVMLGGGTIDG